MSKKNFILTINEKSLEYYNDILNYLTSLTGMNYCLAVEHIGQPNKHYHVYVQYKFSKKLSVRKLKGAHIDKCYGSAQSNIEYLKCLDEKHISKGISCVVLYEEGSPSFKGGYYTVGELRSCKDPSNLPAIYYNIYKKIKEEEENIMDINKIKKEIEVYYIQGPSGIGKTNKALEMIKEKEEKYGKKFDMLKYENGFWIGCNDNKVALYDDFRDSHMKPSEFIHFIDYNKHFLNIKCGSKLNKYEFIILTSVQRLEDIYKNVFDEPRKQWERRIHLIDMY